MIAMAVAAMLLTLACETVQQLAFKQSGRDQEHKIAWIALGAGLHVPHLMAWLYTLSIIPLAIATPWLGAGYITVPLAAQVIFREPVGTRRWVGIAAIILGLILVSGDLKS